MPDSSEVTSQPLADQTVQSDASKQSVSGNLSASQYAKRFLKAEVASVPATEPVEQVIADNPANTEQSTAESLQNASAEVKANDPAKAESNAETGDVLSPNTSLDPKTQELFNKRVGKEIEKRRILEEQLAELKAKLDSTPAQAQQQAPTTVVIDQNVPLANINDFQSLDAAHKQAKQAIRWAEEQLDRDDLGEGVQAGEQILTRRDLKDIVRNARISIEDHIPARANFLNKKQQAHQVASQEFPFLRDKDSQEYALAEQIARENPWVNTVPERDWVLGVHIEGLKAIAARKAALAKSGDTKLPVKSTAKPPASQTEVSSAGGSTRETGNTKNRQQLTAEYEKLKAKGGASAKDYAALLSLKDSLKSR